MLFPAHVKRIIFCFVYSEDYHPSLIYPSLEEEIPQPCIIDVDSVVLPQPICKDDHRISFPLESDQPCDHEKIKIVLKPVQISTPLAIIFEPDHQLTISHDQPTAFQVKIRTKMFKPLQLPHLLHPYPDDCYEYLPLFSGENQTSAEGHAESFLDFVDRFSIVHEDVIMRMFSKYLIKDAATWFKSLSADSIGSWTEFSNAFLKYWDKYKSIDSYLADFYASKREQDEALHVFNRRFHRAYYDIPLEIRPTEMAAMVYYLMAQHNELVLLLLERKSSSLGNWFEDAQEVEENIRASRWIRMQADSENLQTYEQEDYEYISESKQESSEYEANLDQQPEGEYISDLESDSSTLVECSRDREQEGDQFSSKGTTMVERERNEVEADLGQQPTCEFNLVSGSDFSIFAEYSRDRYACEAYDQSVNQEEPMMIVDCEINYMYSADYYPCDGDPVLLSSCEHYYSKEVVVFDDHELISRRQEDDQSFCRRTVMAEQEAAIDVQLFLKEQHVSYLLFKDPVVAFMELRFSEVLKVSDFFNSPMFSGKYGFPKSSLSLWLHVQHHLLISKKDKISSVFKLLGWLLWKSAFT
jgi:hypothetical protein